MEQYRRLLTLLILHPTAHAAGKVQGDSSAPPSSTQYTLRRRIERAYDADPAINIAATMLPCGHVAQISKVSRRIARLPSLFLQLQFHILFFQYHPHSDDKNPLQKRSGSLAVSLTLNQDVVNRCDKA